MLFKKFFNSYFLKKKNAVKRGMSWDNLLALSTPLYLLMYWWIFSKLGFWSELPNDLKSGKILTSGSLWMIILYLVVVLFSTVVTHAGVTLWKIGGDSEKR